MYNLLTINLYFRMNMRIWISSLLFCLVRSQYINDYPCPHPCDCSVSYDSKEPIVDVFCAISSINGNQTDFSQLETNITSILHIDCAPHLHSFLCDRGFERLYSFKAVSFRSCRFDAIHEHALRGLDALTELRIDGAKNLKIHRNAFVNTPNLRRLTIINSGMHEFPVLNGLQYLEFINFTNNVIENINNIRMLDNNEIFHHLYVVILNNNLISEINLTFHSTIPVIKYIALADNRISYISPIAFKLLNFLEFLDLSGNNLSELPGGLISDLSSAKIISLGSNPISIIPQGFFSSVKELQVLDLHSTQIDDSVWDNIQNLSSLHELQLGNCAIRSLTRHYLSKLNLVQYLDISGNHIKKLSNYTFIDMHSLETLLLSNNNISLIDAHAFEVLGVLKNLDLTGNKLVYVHHDTFTFSPNLSLLNISYNVLTQFPRLSNLHNLFVLDLRHNRINGLDNESLAGLVNLGGVNLDRNHIRFIRRNVFQNTPSLQLLRLSHNDIEMIDRSAFLGMDHLKWVFLDHNQIEDISYCFTDIPSLIQLDLRHNRIGGILHSGYFFKSSSLQELYLSFNKISTIERGTFDGLFHLEIVDLKYNNISTLSPHSLMFSPLVEPPPTIYLKGNPFVCDCHIAWIRQCLNRWTEYCRTFDVHEFGFLNCYRGYGIKSYTLIRNVDAESMMCYFENPCDNGVCDCCFVDDCKCRIPCPQNCICLMSYAHQNSLIDCSNQNLTDIYQTVPTAVKILYLDGNNFTFLNAEIFNDLYQLDILYLNNTGINIIENGSFTHLSKLKRLYLNKNRLQEITFSLFIGLSSLENLNLEDNRISFIADDAFTGINNVRTLCLANNRLASPNSYLDPLVNLEYLTLARNPWSCDCDILEDLKTITYTLADVMKDRREIYCHVNNSQTSNQKTGIILNVIDLDFYSICPNQTTIHIYANFTNGDSSAISSEHIQALTGTLVTVILSVIIATILLINRKLLQVVLYNKFGFRFWHEETDDNKLYDAFISYSHKDEDFIVHELLPRLENKEGYKLCVHFRDFPIGASIADTIIDAVNNSRRTLMIVSNNFLDSEWCQYEFKTAHHSVLKEKSKRIILILMEDVDSSKFDDDLQLYIKTKTYVKREDPWFWGKVLYAMPEITNRGENHLNDLDKVRVEVKRNIENETKFQKNIV